jgi:hypothetical protein
MGVMLVEFTTEAQRAQRGHGGFKNFKSEIPSVPPPCTLCLCGELSFAPPQVEI